VANLAAKSFNIPRRQRYRINRQPRVEPLVESVVTPADETTEEVVETVVVEETPEIVINDETTEIDPVETPVETPSKSKKKK